MNAGAGHERTYDDAMPSGRAVVDVPAGHLYLGEAIDPASRERTGEPVLLEAADLTTHGVIVGMTGSGKTGLGVDLLEEALLAGVPTLVVDPKGDLGNLLLTFPDLAPADFAPWVESGDPAAVATQWREGLADWGVGPDRIAALRAAADFTIYTPGSTSGVPLNVVGSLRRPAEGTDAETVADEVEGFVSGLLGMVGVTSDPLSGREHILLANLIHDAWDSGVDLDLATLVARVQDPPLRKLGVYDLDAFFPPKDRTGLAMTLNGLLASRAFAAWAEGPDLDLDRLLRSDDGARPGVRHRQPRPPRRRGAPVRRVAAARQAHHLDAAPAGHRHPAGARLLRRGDGLRAADRGAARQGPDPHAVQAGPGVRGRDGARHPEPGGRRLQGPVERGDLDDRAPADRAGQGPAARRPVVRGGEVDVRAAGDLIGSLDKRQFMLRAAGASAPSLFTTRWAMSYLRGPLTREQISTLMADRRAALAPRRTGPRR